MTSVQQPDAGKGAQAKMSAEDRAKLAHLRNAARELAVAVASYALAIAEELANDELIEQLQNDDHDLDDTQEIGCPHEWDIAMDGSPNFKIDVCLHCNAERSTDLHTGKETIIAP